MIMEKFWGDILSLKLNLNYWTPRPNKQPTMKPKLTLKNGLPYSAANSCFNKGLCVIWNKGTLNKHK